MSGGEGRGTGGGGYGGASNAAPMRDEAGAVCLLLITDGGEAHEGEDEAEEGVGAEWGQDQAVDLETEHLKDVVA